MNEINKFRIFNKLKSIYRINSVEDRKESTAEHTWSCLMLADFFLSEMKDKKIDRLKVYELLMYHDIVEIEAGDTPLHPDNTSTDKRERESKALATLQKQIPTVLSEKFGRLFNEFEAMQTIEARFAKAVDALDAEIHELNYKKDWKGWTADFLVAKKSKLFHEFPKMKKVFESVLKYLIENNYFNQS
ncbi:MAG: HD domain-containing protein [bacterium]|nr:HD domain-containing protein [bacterium]